MRRLKSFTSARNKVFGAVRPLPEETVDLASARGRVLVEDIRADRDLPPFHRSAMDGYAVKAEDTASAPSRLKVIGEAVPGKEFGGVIKQGEAVRIMTGAALPDGADAVQMVEVCSELDGVVEIRETVSAMENVAPQGEDASAGDIILSAGSLLTPAAIALLASVGKTEVQVRRCPVIGIAVNGDEVIPPDQIPARTQIRDANSHAIASRLEQAGAEIRSFGIIGDDESSIAGLFSSIVEVDALILTGGVSMGRYDFVKNALENAGAEIIVSGVAIKPGKPFTFALVEDKPVFALPGNPVSGLVTTELFVIPAIDFLKGLEKPGFTIMRAELRGEVKSPGERTAFLPVSLGWDDGVPFVVPLPYHGSGDFVNFAKAEALLVIPAKVSEYDSASIVDIVPLEGRSWRSD